MRLPDERIEDSNEEARAWELLAPWDVHPGNARLERHAVYTFQARCRRTVAGRADLPGRRRRAPDAAVRRQGMCAGLRDAANLAWKLDLVLDGRAAPEILATYDEERRPSAVAAIDFSIELGKVICVPDPEEAAARDEAMAARLRRRAQRRARPARDRQAASSPPAHRCRGAVPAGRPRRPVVRRRLTAPAGGLVTVDPEQPSRSGTGGLARRPSAAPVVDLADAARACTPWFEGHECAGPCSGPTSPCSVRATDRGWGAALLADLRGQLATHRTDPPGGPMKFRKPRWSPRPCPRRWRGRCCYGQRRPIRSRSHVGLRRLGRLRGLGRGSRNHRAPRQPPLRCPVPRPRQVFAIGLNYRSHAEESGMAVPDVPATFTKFPASLAGPSTTSRSSGRASTGRSSWSRSSARGPTGWRSRMPGPTSRASPSARTSATASAVRCRDAFSLGKSRRGYGPLGPWVVTLDELTTRTTWHWAVRSTARSCKTPGPVTWSMGFPGCRRALIGAPARARRHHLHGHTGRRRRHPQAPASWPRGRSSSPGSRASAPSPTGASDVGPPCRGELALLEASGPDPVGSRHGS